VIRVLIADDHQVVRSGLEQLLATAPDIELVAMAANGDEAVALAHEHEPDIVLMDLSMPEVDGVAATRRIAASSLTTQVVVLTSFSDRQRILDALDAGAAGYVLKHAEPDELLEAIRAAHDGGSPLDPKAARVVLDRQRSGSASPAKMSDREIEVLRLVASGLANKHIARQLGIAERTVKAHLTNVFQRIGVTDRTQAALWARDHLPPDPED
jgi:DNA-binding NarL/FixJ family response regulator